MTGTRHVRTVARRLAHSLRRISARLDPERATAGWLTDGSADSKSRTREAIAAAFLRGRGLEIGALHQPLKIPPSASVRYVDRMSVSDLRRHYPELASLPLVEVDVIDDGERLTHVESDSQEFVVANHFLEHCENPILTLQNMLRVLAPGGVLYLAIPDKRFTFDVDRASTTIDHLERDFVEGPAWSRRAHFVEWARLVDKVAPDRVETEATRLMASNYSIHFHVWTSDELLEFMLGARRHVTFALELFVRNGAETIAVLRKP